jgi:glycosyltransferase involved in cell wall biosynthesis
VVKFKIIIPSYNCEKWIGKCLASVEKQTFRNFDVCVIDDASPCANQRDVIKRYCERNGWKHVFNEINKGALSNIVAGIRLADPKDDDVIINLDGDDWLYGRDVLEKLRRIYDEEDVYLTYGQLLSFPAGTIGCSRPLTAEQIEKKLHRKITWAFSHLRTFKYFLWKHVKDEDLRDENGEYFRVSWDLAIMYPMAEMAGRQLKFINELLLFYNNANPINDYKVRLSQQEAAAKYIQSRPPYPTLLRGRCEWNSKNFLNTAKMTLQRFKHRGRWFGHRATRGMSVSPEYAAKLWPVLGS